MNELKREKVIVKGETYEVGFSFRAMREFEKLAGKHVSELRGTWDEIMYNYCVLLALNEEFEMKFDEFVDWCDSDPSAYIKLHTTRYEAEQDEIPDEPTKKKETITTKNLFVLWIASLLLLVSPVSIPVISGIALVWLSLRLLVRLIGKIGKKPV